ncbi:MAG: hypothetical protein IKU82_00215 [Clostridia bacterium]|nr:hypothetical protein [Clostridia bacterium]
MKTPKRKFNPKVLSIKRQYASCFVTLFASFLIGLAVRTILNWPIAAILSDNDMLRNNIMSLIDGIIGTIVTLVVLFMLSLFDGYYHNKFVLKRLLVAIVLTFATQVVLAIVLGHSVWFSGLTGFFATYVSRTMHSDMVGVMGFKKILENYRWIFMIIAFWTLYAPLMLFGRYLGSKKSKKDFAKAKEEKAKEKVLGGHPFD